MAFLRRRPLRVRVRKNPLPDTALFVSGIALIVTAAGAALVLTQKKAAAQSPAPTPQPAPPGIIADPAQVAIAQGIVADFCGNNNIGCAFAANDIDKDWANPKFQTALAALQKNMNDTWKHDPVPAGAHLPARTDGMLDENTYILITHLF